MEQNPVTPTEASNEPWFFDVWGMLDKTWDNYVKPTVSALWNFAWWVKDAVVDAAQDIASGNFDIFENDAINDARKLLSTSVVDDEDRVMAKRLNEYGWWDMTKDLVWWIAKLWYQKVVWPSMSSKLIWTWEDEFQWSLQGFAKQRQSIQSELDKIYTWYPTVQKVWLEIENAYKKDRWVSEISDPQDYSNFRLQYISQLDWITQAKFKKEYTDLKTKASDKEKALSQIDWSMREYINTRFQWWEEEYNKFINSNEDAFKNNQFFWMLQEMNEKESKLLDAELSKRWPTMAKLWKEYNELRDAVLEDRVADRQYYLSVLWMDIPDNEKIAEQFKLSSDVKKKFDIQLLSNLADMKDLPEYQNMSDVDYRNAIRDVTWKWLSEQEKDLFRKKETIVTGIQQLKHWKDFAERSNFNPLWIVDWLNYVGATMQWIVDQVYDYEWWTPNYVKSETRNIAYSWEWMIMNWLTWIAYNTDAIASFIALWAIGKLWEVTKIPKLLWASVDKVLQLPVKIWFWEAPLRIIWSSVKWLTKSSILNAATDPVLDAVMQEAPTDAIKEFNAITWLIFDAWIEPLAKAWTKKTIKTWNELLYEFMTNKEDKAVIEDVVRLYKDKWVELSKDEAKSFLSEASKQIISVTNPEKIKQIFEQPWELFSFIGNNIKQMDERWMKSLVTETGLWIKIEKALWVPEWTYNDITNLTKYLIEQSDKIPQKTKEIVQASIDKQFESISSFLDGKMQNWVRIVWTAIKDPEFIELRKNTLEDVKYIKMLTSSGNKTLSDMTSALESIKDNIAEINKRFTNQKTVQRIKLTSLATKWAETSVYLNVDDITELSWKTWKEIIQEWKVTLPQSTKYDAWDYILSWVKQKEAKSAVTAFMNSERVNIQQYMKERWYGHVDAWKTIENILSWFWKSEWKSQRATSIWFLSDIAKKEWIQKAYQEAEEFGKFVHSIFEKFYWKENVWSVYKIHDLWIEINPETNRIKNHKDLLDIARTKDKTYNIFYGDFQWDLGPNTFSMYFLYWKDMEVQPFLNKLTWEYNSTTWYATLQNYLASAWSINEKIISNWMKDGEFSLSRWIERTKVIESVNANLDLFTNWKLDEKKLHQVLSDSHIKQDWISKFVYEILKNATEDQASYIKPMAYSLVASYINNKSIVDKLIADFKYTGPYINALASVILSPNLYSQVVKNVAKKEEQYALDIIKANIDAEILNLWVSKQLKIDQLEDSIKNMKDIRSAISNKTQKEQLSNDIDAMIKQVNLLKSKEIDEFSAVTNLSEMRLKEMARTFTLSIASWQEIRHASEQDILKAIRSAKELESWKKEILTDALQQLDEVKVKWDYEWMVTTIEALKNNNRYDPIRDILNTFIGKIMSEWDLNIQDTSLISKDLIRSNWLYLHEFAIDPMNNPVIKMFKSFYNDTQTWQNTEFNKVLRWIFWFEWFESPGEMYLSKTNKSYKEFVDSLVANNDNIPNKKEILKSKFMKLKWVTKIRTTEMEDAFDELLDKALDERSLIDVILRSTRMIEDPRFIVTSIEKWNVWTISNVMERVIQVDNLLKYDKSWESKFISWVWVQWFASLVKWQWDEIDKYKKFIQEININWDKKLYNKLWIEDTNYIFVGNFWDKDSLYSFYKAPADLFSDKISRADKASITIDYYNYVYAYSNWYKETWTLESFVKEFKDKRFSSYKEFSDHLEKVKEDHVILPVDVIRKREAFNMSNFNTFDEVKLPLKTYIIAEDIDYPEELSQVLSKIWERNDNWEFDFIDEKAFDKIWEDEKWNPIYDKSKFSQEVENELRANINLIKDDSHWANASSITDSKDFYSYFNSVYLKDLQDGTSFISKHLAKLRWKIRWVKDTNQFKDHFYWNKEDESRFGWKTLFNASEIRLSESWKKENDIVAIGASSAKLKKWRYNDNPYVKEIWIDWKKYKVIWQIKWTDTSYFKNASSDTNKVESEVSFSDSIKPKLSLDASNKIEAIQLEEIQKAFDKHIESLKWYSINVNSYWDAIETIRRISSVVSMWHWVPGVVRWKLDAFISDIHQIINKPKEEWQSMFIRQSDSNIAMNEIIISKNSHLADTIKEIDWDKYVIGYRYPVPSRHNLWLYKVRFAEDLAKEDPLKFWKYKNMGDHQTVMHPFATYMKVEWDNDGDHLFFLSAESRIGKIIKDDILNWKDIKDYKNTFVVAEQVEKTKWWAKQNILDSRTVALEAKNKIWVVSATIRTIFLMDKLFSLSKEEKDNYMVKIWKESMSVSQIEEKYFWTDWYLTIPRINTDWEKLAASVLQTTLDFWNSWKTSFDVWQIRKLVDMLQPNELDEWNYYDDIISKLSMSYWVQNKMKKAHEFVRFMKSWEIDWAIGSKKSLYKKVYSMYWDHLEWLNITNEWNSLLNMIQSPGKELASAVEWISKIKWIASATKFWFKTTNAYKLAKEALDKLEKNELTNINKLTRERNKYKFIKQQEDISKNIRSILRESFAWDKNAIAAFDLMDKAYSWNEPYYKLLDMIKDRLVNWELSKDQRNAIGIYTLSLWEIWTLFHYITDDQIIQYFNMADDNLLKKMKELHWDSEIVKSWKRSVSKEDRIKELQTAIDELKQLWSDDAEDTILEMSKEFDELSNAISTAEPEIIAKDLPEIKVEDFNYPELITYKEDFSIHAMDELVSENSDFVWRAKDWATFLMSTLFSRFAPELKTTFDDLMSYLRIDKEVELAWEHHVMQFSNQMVFWLWYKNSMYQQMKRAWMNKDTIEKVSREIQKEFLSYEEKRYALTDIEKVKQSVSAVFEANKLPDLTKNIEFTKELENYKKNTMERIYKSIVWIETLWYDLHKAYEWLDFSMITDIIETSKWDPQLTLKLHWIKPIREWKTTIPAKQVFIDLIKSRARELWQNIADGTVKAMAESIFKSNSALESVLNFFKSWHYSMTYWVWWMITGNAIVAWLAQIYPNLVELNSYRMVNADKLAIWNAILSKYKLMNSEDVLWLGTWHGKNMQASAFELLMWKMTRELWGKLTTRRWWEILDWFVNNMLGFNDWPLEQLRKTVAVVTVMERMWYKTLDQFDDAVERGGQNFLKAFHSKVRTHFAETWGWAVSSSPFERWTIFEHSNQYFDNFITQFAVKSLSYLMGWSFHKAWSFLEKESAWFVWLNKLVHWDLKWAKAHMSDFIAYNAMMWKQFAYTTGIYLKFQKYEKDNQDRLSLKEFQYSFNNSLVSLEILLGRHKEAWMTAWQLWTTEDQIYYTAYTVFDRMFRLFKQPRFFSVMYDKYRSDEMINWEWDMSDAFMYAVEQQYTSFMRFNAMIDTEDIFSKLSSSNIWVLWVGWSTYEETLFDELQKWWAFAWYKERWFIGSFLNTFTSMVKNKESSLWMNVWIDVANQIYSIVMKDPELKKLVNAGTIGTWAKEYNLANLLGLWQITEEQYNDTKQLWSAINNANYFEVDEKWRRILRKAGWWTYPEANLLSYTENIIDKQLAKKWISVESLISDNPDRQRENIKMMATLSLEAWVSTPSYIAYILNKEFNKQRKDIQNKEWVLTWEKSDYNGKPYKSLTEQREMQLKRDIIIKNQWMFNLDRRLAWEVLWVAVNNIWQDIFSKFDKIENWNFIRDNVVDIVNREYLAKKIMNTWDTSVSSLYTKYALAFKWITWNETWARAILKFINDVNSSPIIEKKVKLANTSAMLMALNKTQYNLLKDNKLFSQLTEDAQKQLTNWMYDTIKWWQDFDSNTLSSKLSWSAYVKPYIPKKYYPKWKSDSFSGQRPNFSKQFSPLQDYMKWKQHWINDNPDQYLKAKNNFEYQSPIRSWDPQNPYMKQYAKYAIEQMYFGQTSKWIIATKQNFNDNKLDKSSGKYINIKKPKAPKNKQKKTFKKPFKEVSGWLMSNLPFSNYN